VDAAKIEAAIGRLLRFHEENDLPNFGDVLPWRQGVGVLHDKLGKAHRFTLPGDVFRRPIDSPGQLRCYLGWLPIPELVAREEIGRYDRPETRLAWSVISRFWTVRRMMTGARVPVSPFDTGANIFRMAVPEWDVWLQLNGRLRRWARDVPALARPPAKLPELDACLSASGAGAAVYRAVLETRLPEPAHIAWRLAWVDRLCVFLQDHAVLAPTGPLPWTRVEFLTALRDALVQWPELMYRALALAELLRTLLTGGPGLAALFQDQRTTLLPQKANR
jgi:hypothetical protein